MTRSTPLPPSGAPVSVGFVSLGCAKNLVDSQVMAGVLLSEGAVLAPSPDRADIILVNTCAFIEDAREEAAESIVWACDRKRAGACRAVLVTGCLSQRYRERLREAFPEVDGFIGLDELEQVGDVVRRLHAGQHGLVEVSERSRALFDPRLPALVLTGGPYAYLKVGEGCDHACAFCAIPGIRGPYRSRPEDALIDEVRALLDAGIKEIDLISQDVTCYGRDLQPVLDLPHLLRRLDALDGEFWLRMLYGYPAHVTDELLDVMQSSRHLCAYLDIPIQHRHPDVLRAMRRADTIKPLVGFAERVRAAVPGIALRTTCLLGFPGETEAHVEALLEYISAVRFDHLGAFVFSPEEDTAAFEMEPLPELEVAEARRDRVMALQAEISAERLARMIGSDHTVLLEQPEADEEGELTGRWEARTRRQAPEVDGRVLVEGVPETIGMGAFGRVTVTEARDYDLVGRWQS